MLVCPGYAILMKLGLTSVSLTSLSSMCLVNHPFPALKEDGPPSKPIISTAEFTPVAVVSQHWLTVGEGKKSWSVPAFIQACQKSAGKSKPAKTPVLEMPVTYQQPVAAGLAARAGLIMVT